MPQSHHRPKSKVLFILKRREDFADCPSYSQNGISTGLLNSATFVLDMLVNEGYESKLVVVIDNNDIDREVRAYNPTHVIIEALWVVPEKFEILSQLHPRVKWVVRFHSESPFIAGEGIAMGWIHGYIKQPNLILGVNAPRFMSEIKAILAASGVDDYEIDKRVIYLPNYYPVADNIQPHVKHPNRTFVNVGCFGAIRPLKNHLLQAIAALKFADTLEKPLHFHINIGRVEMKGDPILNNLKQLFEGLNDNGHELVMHTWAPHEQFLDVIKDMDIGLQVSYSETFNIVAADMVTAGVPMVMSDEIPWGSEGIANPTSSTNIAYVMVNTWNNMARNVNSNVAGLTNYVNKSIGYWKDFL